MQKEPVQKTTLYIPQELHRSLQLVAKRHKRSFNAEVVWALEHYCAQLARTELSEQSEKPEKESSQ